MKRIFSIAVLLFACMATYAKHVDITIITSCGYEYHISEVGDNITAKELVDFAEYIDYAFCE